MSLFTGLQLKHSQSLVMTPQLMQSIKLLQFTSLELSKFIEEQVQSNPLLEIKDPSNDASTPISDNVQLDNRDVHSDSANESGMNEFGQMETSLDVNLENVFPDDERLETTPVNMNKDLYVGASGEISAAGSDIDLDSFAANGPGMREAMYEQIAMNCKVPAERFIAADLVDYLDDAGYLQADLYEIANRLGVEQKTVEQVLDDVQQFDPAGIFARSLAECLALQLQRIDRFDPAMKALVDNLELLGKRDFKALKNICGVDEADLLDMMSDIQSLDPKPGGVFQNFNMQTIVPDVFVKQAKSGEWHIEMNSHNLPKVLVNQSYFAKVTEGLDKKDPDYEFMSECMQSANWLSRSLDQRAKTIIKVAAEIVKQQTEFFAKGVSCLKPLNLRSVADAIGMHESTISRVTSNKYMMTPRGLFELRYFFTTAISGGEGADPHSAEAIRFRIKSLIDSEVVENVLSDDEIVKKLKTDGVDIARRTVAKYREAMNLSSSVQRRREKKLRAQHQK